MICNKRLSDVMLLVFDFGRKSTVTFSKGCLDALGDPEYVLVMINLEKRTLMLVKAEKGGARSKKPKGYRVEKNDEGAYVMENCDLFLSKVAELMVWKTDRSTKMFFMGRENDGKVVFELSDVAMYKTGDADWRTRKLEEARLRCQIRKARFSEAAVKMKELRQRLGVSRNELARKTGVSSTLIWNIENERAYLSNKMMERIEKAYPEVVEH